LTRLETSTTLQLERYPNDQVAEEPGESSPLMLPLKKQISINLKTISCYISNSYQMQRQITQRQ